MFIDSGGLAEYFGGWTAGGVSLEFRPRGSASWSPLSSEAFTESGVVFADTFPRDTTCYADQLFEENWYRVRVTGHPDSEREIYVPARQAVEVRFGRRG